MSVTIFCTFEQPDFADLAAGRLKSSVAGLKSIHYVNNGLQGRDDPARPVTMRVCCAPEAASQVRGKLINMHGYQIITSG